MKKNSQLLVSAKQGDPQAIASFLGNHLAGFSLWVTATANHRYLDLHLESIDPPQPGEIVPLIQQLLCQLRPESVELVKISGRKFDEIPAAWEQTFRLSEVLINGDVAQFPPSLTPITTPSPLLNPDVILSDLFSLVLAVNEALQPLNVAAKIERIDHILNVELRALQVPKQTQCLPILYEALARLDMPGLQAIRVQGFTAKQLMPSWVEELPARDVLLTAQISTAAQFRSFREEEEFWRPIGVGVVAGLVVFALPLLNFAFQGVTTVIFDGSQAIGYLLMGYLPVLEHHPLQGGGIKVLEALGRSPWVIGLVYGLWGYSFYRVRHVPILLTTMVAIAVMHSAICWTALALPVAQLLGHLTLWSLSLLLLYCAFARHAYRNQGERALYVAFSVFFSLDNISHYLQLFRSDPLQTNWLAFLGLAITLVIPFLSYQLFILESRWLPQMQNLMQTIKKSSLTEEGSTSR